MNETRRTALEFALRVKWRSSHDMIRAAALFEAYLTNNDAVISPILEEKSSNSPAPVGSDLIAPLADMFEVQS